MRRVGEDRCRGGSLERRKWRGEGRAGVGDVFARRLGLREEETKYGMGGGRPSSEAVPAK